MNQGGGGRAAHREGLCDPSEEVDFVIAPVLSREASQPDSHGKQPLWMLPVREDGDGGGPGRQLQSWQDRLENPPDFPADQVWERRTTHRDGGWAPGTGQCLLRQEGTWEPLQA